VLKAVIGSLTILLSLLPLQVLSASKLSQSQIYAIQQGWHAPYSEETIQQVLGTPKYQPKKSEFQVPLYIPQSYWEEPADKWMWVLFWGIQLADIYSTQEGVKWDCISEANPLLPSIPTVAEMAVLKGVILFPSYGAIGYENINRGDLIAPLLLGGVVVHHNLKLTKKAEKRCDLR
jgi:hypothetical protein